MRFPNILILGAVSLMAAPLTAQPALVCPTGAVPAGRSCELFHYHVAMYRPDTKQHVEIYGTTQFATQAACERAREARVAANAKVVEFFRVKQDKYEADRFGPCHCDMTSEKASPNFLGEVSRAGQLRTAEEIRLRVRERLLDAGLASDHVAVRSLDVPPPVTPLLGTAKLVPLPQTGRVAVVTSPDDLKPTRTIDTSKPTVAAMDLPLVDVLAAPPPPVVTETSAASPVAAESPAPANTTAPSPAPAPAPAPAEPPIAETVVEVPAPVDAQPQAQADVQGNGQAEDVQSAEEIADRFIEYENERIQNVLKAAVNVVDADVNSRIFSACMERLHLLSNLRLLIQGAGTRSRLANAARSAESEADRLTLIGKLFGDDITEHWAPKDASDVILDFEANVANSPERVLRDTTGAVTANQKKKALYLVLAQTEPTEDQRLWLSTVVEGFLR